jgi:signal transduction histidine kinase
MLAISARPLTGALSGQLGLDGGQAGVALIVVRDRTEELLRQRAERDFVANAAHEMRNPVAAIRAAVDALEAGAKDDPDARTHFLDALAHESQRLGRLLRALLMLARAEAAAGTIATLTDAPIRPVLDRLAAGQPEVRVTCDPPRLVARCEPDLLEQALSALLSNALRHTATAVQLDARLDDAGVVTISVTDDGSGIPPTERAHVFERFYRGSNAAGEGAGLGLSIARRLVAAQGGTLSLAEAPAGAGGTRFLIRLPAGPTPLVDEVDAGAAATLGA